MQPYLSVGKRWMATWTCILPVVQSLPTELLYTCKQLDTHS